jgi:hypothetical protein
VPFHWERSENDIIHIKSQTLSPILYDTVPSTRLIWHGMRYGKILKGKLGGAWRSNSCFGALTKQEISVSGWSEYSPHSYADSPVYWSQVRAVSQEPIWNIGDWKCNYRVPSLWSSVLPRLGDWTFDAVDSRVDVLRLSEYLTVCMCVFMSRRGMGKGALGRIPSSDSWIHLAVCCCGAPNPHSISPYSHFHSCPVPVSCICWKLVREYCTEEQAPAMYAFLIVLAQ